MRRIRAGQEGVMMVGSDKPLIIIKWHYGWVGFIIHKQIYEVVFVSVSANM